MRANWTETTLGVVATLGNGGAWGADEPGDGLVDAACLRGTDLADLINGEQPTAPVRWLKESELTKARCVENMILIETSGSKCGRSVLLTKKMLDVFERPVVFSNFCRTLRIDLEKILNKYAELWFSHAYATGLIPSYRATSAMPNLDIKSLLRIEKMLIPPLSEQKRIVDVIVSVDAYIAALQQQADDARTARNAVLQELLSAGGQHWTETTLGEITNINPEDTARMSPHEEITYIDLSSVSNEGGVSNELFRGPYSGAPGRARRIVRAQDVLVSTVRPYLKGFAVVPIHLDGAIASTGFSVLRANTRYSLPGYIWTVVGTARFVEDLMDKATGSSYPAVRPSDIASHLVNLPPLAEQKRIVETVTAMDDVVSTTEQAVRVAQELRSGLLSNLLTGEHEIPVTYDRLLGAA
jgi:restriction endonuclease S subunit